MKKLIAVAAMIMLFTSCTKSGENGLVNFKISGVRNVDLTNNIDASDEFTVQITGDNNPVTLSIDDMPRGVLYTITPSSGTPPFSAVIRFWNVFDGEGGTQGFHVTGRSSAGNKDYPMSANFTAYRGWKFDGIIYSLTGVSRVPGSGTKYPQIKAFGGGAGELTISFAQGATLPTSTTTYIIANGAPGPGQIKISMVDDPEIYQAIGDGKASGTFVFDKDGRFLFKCSKVEMSNGVQKKELNCSFSE